MALDFFGVRLAARIYFFPDGPGGKMEAVELWTDPYDVPKRSGIKKGASHKGTQRFEALSYVSQVNLELFLGDNSKLQVVLTPPFEVGLQFLQSDIVRFGTGRLEVEIGYSTGTPEGAAAQFQTLPFFGLMQKPDVSIGTDVTITLNALGVGYAMTTVGGSESKPFPEKLSPAEVVESVLKKYESGFTNLDVKDLYSEVPPSQKDKTTGDLFFRPVADHTSELLPDKKSGAESKSPVLVQGPRNDWWFIRETIENYGYDLFIQASKVFIAKKTDWLNRPKGFGDASGVRKHFMLKGNVDPYLNLYPILSFQTPTQGVWMENGLGCQVARDLSEDKTGETRAEASAYETEITQVKEKGGLDCKKSLYTSEPNEASKNVPVNPNSPEGRAKMHTEWRKTMMTAGIQGEFATLGVPGLRPGEVVQVSGFERKDHPDNEQVLFNGPYGVINVRHSIGVGGFMTNFMGIMNFFPKAFREAHMKTKGEKVENEAVDTKQNSSTKKSKKRKKTQKQ